MSEPYIFTSHAFQVNDPPSPPPGKLTYSQIASKPQASNENAFNGIASSDDESAKTCSKTYKDAVASKPLTSQQASQNSLPVGAVKHEPIPLQTTSRNFNSSSSDTTIKSPITPTWKSKVEQSTTLKNDTSEWVQSRYKTSDYKKTKKRNLYPVDGELDSSKIPESQHSSDTITTDEVKTEVTTCSQSGKEHKQINWFEDDDDDNINNIQINLNTFQPPVDVCAKDEAISKTPSSISSSSDQNSANEESVAEKQYDGADIDHDSSDHESIPSPSISDSSSNEADEKRGVVIDTTETGDDCGVFDSQNETVMKDFVNEVKSMSMKEDNSNSDYDSDRDEFFSSYCE